MGQASHSGGQRPALRIVSLALDRVQFTLDGGGRDALVTVLRGADGSPLFPHAETDGGTSLGTPARDALARELARVEWLRLDAVARVAAATAAAVVEDRR